MDPLYSFLLAIVSSSGVATIVVAVLNHRWERKRSSSQKLDAIMAAQRVIMVDRVHWLGSSYIKRGAITLEEKENLSFKKLEGQGFKVGGKELRVQLTCNLMQIFAFVMGEICDIFAKRGEKVEDFHSLAEFRKHFLTYYDLDDNLKAALDGVNPAALSRALVSIDIKYNYTARHFRSGDEE